MGAWNAILYALSVAVTELEKWAYNRRQAKRQTERDKLENDPGIWFADHFNGLPIEPDKTKTNSPDSKPDRD